MARPSAAADEGAAKAVLGGVGNLLKGVATLALDGTSTVVGTVDKVVVAATGTQVPGLAGAEYWMRETSGLAKEAKLAADTPPRAADDGSRQPHVEAATRKPHANGGDAWKNGGEHIEKEATQKEEKEEEQTREEEVDGRSTPGDDFEGNERPAPGLEALDDEEPSRRVRGPSGRLYRGRSLDRWYVYESPRRIFIKIVEFPLFDHFIALTILANVVMMAWQSPLDPVGTPKAHFIDMCEWVFLFIFTAELSIKVVAYGLVGHSHAYLNDPWCQLDAIVVTLAWLPILIPTMGNYSMIRSLRGLRTLRTLKFMPGMPMLSASPPAQHSTHR